MNKKRIIYFTLVGVLFVIASFAGILFSGVPATKDTDFNVTSNGYTEDSKAVIDLMTDQIIKGIKKEYPYLATLESPTNKLEIQVEDNSNGYAIGRYSYVPGTLGGSGTWFAKNTSDGWKVFNVGYNYWGDCKYFWENEFPKDMTPDCYNYEKMEHVETMNPERFFVDGFNFKDKGEIIQAYIAFKKMQSEKVAKAEDLAIRVGTQTKDYLEGMMLTEKIEQHSAPYFLAVRIETGWKVIFEGQSDPPCELVDSYDFPSSIVSTCVMHDKTSGDYEVKERL